MKITGDLVLIVPLWNWNDIKHLHPSLYSACINCTVVELKQRANTSDNRAIVVLIVPLWNWNKRSRTGNNEKRRINCTVVELKQPDAKINGSNAMVLIVPLWNWNCRRWQSFCACLSSINCTVVELKRLPNRNHFLNTKTVLIVPLWNWNDFFNYLMTGNQSINCTVVELKLGRSHKKRWTKTVLIVPLWNWNNAPDTGLTSGIGVLIVPLWNWNYYSVQVVSFRVLY